MLQLLLAAPSSGSGKTTAACALLSALKARGLEPCAFKCGPDYIDPMFHRAVLGVPSHNLDLFFSTPQTVRRLYTSGAAGHGSAVCEGAMGYYDGLGGVSAAASAWHTADVLDLPVLLVVRPKGASLTLAAQLQGLKAFRTPHHIAGVLLNDCTEMLYKLLAPMLERETGLPVVGFLPPMPDAAIESRHLGLKTAGEIADLQQKIQILTAAAQKNIDWPRLLALFDRPAPMAPAVQAAAPTVRIAVAQDEAFCFTYAETLESLQAAGAELCYFSPLRDAALPQHIGGLYLPGGYPELYAAQLVENRTLRGQLREAVHAGMPCIAECGGFMYLTESIAGHAMVGALPGDCFDTGKLTRFGYITATAQEDSLLCRAGEQMPMHEFHHWDTPLPGSAFLAEKPSGKQWRCAYATDTLYAGFPHFHFYAKPVMAQRFLAACRKETL